MIKKGVMKLLCTMIMITMLITIISACGQSEGSKPAETTPPDSKSSEEDTSPSEEGETEEEVTIVVWGWSQENDEKVFAEFQKKYPNINMEYVSVFTTEAFQKLQTTLSAGLELPDVVPMEFYQRGSMLNLGIWEELEEAPYNFDRNLIFDHLWPVLCDPEDPEGKILCIPSDLAAAALTYRKPLAKEYLGTDDRHELESMLDSWDKFIEYGKQVKEKSGGKVFMFSCLGDIKNIVDNQNSAPIIKDGKLQLEESVKPALEFMIKCREAGIADKIDYDSPAFNTSFSSDKYIFYACATWAPEWAMRPNDPEGDDKWGLMVPPGGCFNWGGTARGIPKEAKNKEAAWKYIEWMSLSEEGAFIPREILNPSTTTCYKKAYENPEYARFMNPLFGSQDMGEIFFKEPVTQPRPISKYDVLIQDTWNLVVQTLNSDDSFGLEDALKLFEEEIRNKAPELQ